MPSVDVAVVGAGLAGLLTALRLTELGARVVVLAQGNGATHWAGGPIDLGVVPGAATPAEAVVRLASDARHPYAILDRDVAPALDWFMAVTAKGGLPHVGAIDGGFGALPTGIGGTRPVAVVPESQAESLRPWAPGERLVLVGQAGFKDFWPRAVAASLSRRAVWGGRSAPGRVDGVVVDLPELAARHNLNPLRISDHFDGPDWRRSALEMIARAVDVAAGRDAVRVGLPAAIGCRVHPEVWADTVARLGRPVFELPLVPPGIPGIRLYNLLRAELIARGGRLLLGEPVARFESRNRRILSLSTTAATREVVTRVGAVVLATGGIEGGGLAGDPSGRVLDTVLGLPLEAPTIEDWMRGDALDPGAMPIAGVGIRTDADLRPVDPGRPAEGPVFENVRVVGNALAGQRWLRERCGDGVAIASAWRAAASLGGEIRPVGAQAPHGAPAVGGVR